ncbi:MAG: hypothetical protein HKO59_06390 [Phycisphaerales bacterium]|nr:carboxypeptidase-like regulatory domain-containing protein [Phycisphaerae bacterium]NNF43895.1 hypothetical protein [Phycisphaerales bacterium]NNK62050.1 hypothetical protein [Gemmatimonadota bacterium]NNM25603.1 hypothetical protein [Phycisphaerales bacterium]
MSSSTMRAGRALALLGGLTATTHAFADVTVSGVIRDEDTLQPIAGALVTLQTTSIRAVTDASGNYTLAIPDEAGSVIVAAAVGYFNRSTTYEGVPADLDVTLAPVPPADDPGYTLLTPDQCGFCHPNQLAAWSDSPMQRAGLNTWLHDIYNGDGTPGGDGGFVYTRDSVFAPTNPASECAACHQPERWLAEPFAPMETPSDATYPSAVSSHGISCETCHKIASVNVENINYPGIIEGALTLTRPAPGHTQVQYGLLGDVDYVESPGFMRASYQPQLAAEVCGACHQDKNDIHEDHTFDGVISEPTYLEWVDTPYADPASPLHASCLDCHMLTNEETQACEILFPPLTRPAGSLRDHDIRGTTPAYLDNAADLEVEATVAGDELLVTVDVTNAYTGHHLPTGVTVRNMILLVEATHETGPLTHTGKQVVHELGGVGSPDEGDYAGLPGKFFAKVNHNADGEGPTFFTDATGITFDSRLPALVTDTTEYRFAVPDSGGAIDVRARLIYRRAFRFLTKAKGWTEDGHGNPLADVQAPDFGHLMESVDLLVTACPSGADLDGSGDVGFFDLLSLLGSWGPCPDCAEDLDGDDAVGFTDLLIMLSNWGPCV